MGKKQFLVGLVIITVLGGFVRLFHYDLPVSFDEEMYIEAAKKLSDPATPPMPRQYNTRIGWLWTLNAWDHLWGASLCSAAALGLLCSTACIPLTALVANQVFGRSSALMAGAIVAINYLTVLHQPRIWPDGEAGVVMMISVYLFLRYMATGGRATLYSAAILGGLLFSIKEYYVLIVIAYGATIVWSDDKFILRTNIAKRFSKLCEFAVCVLIGLSVSPILHGLSSGSGSGTLTPADVANYANHMAERQGTGVLSIIGARFSYFRYLLFDNGVIGGFLLISGAAYLLTLARTNAKCRLISLAGLGFFVFLSLAPVRLRPLTFVEIAARYSVVFIPFLAIGAGALIVAMLARLAADRLMWRMACSLLILGALVNLWAPNYRYSNSTLLPPVAKAVNYCIQSRGSLGFSDLVVPWYAWQPKVSESFFKNEIHILNADQPPSGSSSEYGNALDLLKTHPKAAIFVPVSLRTDPTVRSLECGEGFEAVSVFLPGSSVSIWLNALRHSPGDTLAGYVLVRKSAHIAAESP